MLILLVINFYFIPILYVFHSHIKTTSSKNIFRICPVIVSIPPSASSLPRSVGALCIDLPGEHLLLYARLWGVKAIDGDCKQGVHECLDVLGMGNGAACVSARGCCVCCWGVCPAA